MYQLWKLNEYAQFSFLPDTHDKLRHVRTAGGKLTEIRSFNIPDVCLIFIDHPGHILARLLQCVGVILTLDSGAPDDFGVEANVYQHTLEFLIFSVNSACCCLS